MAHVRTVGIPGIEGVAEIGECADVIGGEGAEQIEGLLRLHEGEADVAVIEHVNQIVGSEWIDLGGALVVPLAETEDDTGLGNGDRWIGRNHGKQAELGGFQQLAVVFKEPQEVEAEVGEGEIGEGDSFGIFLIEIDDAFLEVLELFVAVMQVRLDQVFNLVGGEQVVLAGSG